MDGLITKESYCLQWTFSSGRCPCVTAAHLTRGSRPANSSVSQQQSHMVSEAVDGTGFLAMSLSTLGSLELAQSLAPANRSESANSHSAKQAFPRQKNIKASRRLLCPTAC